MEPTSINPPPFMDHYIKDALIQLARASTIQAQALMTHENQEVVTHPHQQILLWHPV